MLLRKTQEQAVRNAEQTAVPAEEALKDFYEKGIALWGHGTDGDLVADIMKEGLALKQPKLYTYTNRILEPSDDLKDFEWQKREAHKLFEDWPGFRIYPFYHIVLIGIPTKSDGRYNPEIYDSIIQRLPEPRIIYDQPYPYIVPTEYIPGYLDITNFKEHLAADFHHNPNFAKFEPPKL